MFKNKSNFEKVYLRMIREQFDPAEVPAMDNMPVDGENCQIVSFKTTDQALIDALQGGFSKITVVTSVQDENGEVTENPVDFDAASISEVSVAPCDAEGGICPDCGCDPCTCEQGEDEDDGVEECDEEDLEDCDEQGEDEDDGVEECDEEDLEDCDEQDDECDEQSTITGAEWIEDGKCLKCGSSECDGTCVCPKCGDINCIGNCDGPAMESVKFKPRKHGKLISESKSQDKPKKEVRKPAKDKKKK